ncbi:WhiB family transcriptional regulator [Nocardia sp. IFM 10818]
MTWELRASCNGSGASPALWFADKGPDREMAKQICAQECPVRTECGVAARKTGDREGVRAGFYLGTLRGRNALRDWLDGTPAAPTVAAAVRSGPERPAVRTCECGRQFTPPFANTMRCAACLQGLVEVGPTRVHLQRLRAVMSLHEVARRANLAWSTVRSIGSKDERQFVDAEIAEAILAVEPVAEAVPA